MYKVTAHTISIGKHHLKAGDKLPSFVGQSTIQHLLEIKAIVECKPATTPDVVIVHNEDLDAE